MLPWMAIANFAEKQAMKAGLKSILPGKDEITGIKPLNLREDYAMDKYSDPNSPLYKNKELIKEYYNPSLPIDKDVEDWNDEDLVQATTSSLYKYDTLLQNKAYECVKNRAKKNRYCGF